MLESRLRKIPLHIAVDAIRKLAEQHPGDYSIDSADALRLIEEYMLNSGEVRTVDQIKNLTERRICKILDDVKIVLDQKNAISWPIRLNSDNSEES